MNRERVFELDLEARSSVKGRTEDALASQDDEGRGKLRKAWGSGKHTLIPRYPNGAIRRATARRLRLNTIDRLA